MTLSEWTHALFFGDALLTMQFSMHYVLGLRMACLEESLTGGFQCRGCICMSGRD